ncbi:spindle assembly checkpoint component mad1 [Acrodontium crateriforme]|uniref:Spindle assembly checkpoint component MAD1 n=1 Tax=Acrodontium crateriforme TaxID=150365 RepID=A0AAQ3M3B8_9PEZI|nr:spindle assembly checkpoint component mad1 [Acrodontium crateriforme]
MSRHQPTFDLFTGAEVEPPPPPRQPLRETFKQSTATRPTADIGNENLRAQLNTLQYELEAIKQERELHELRHQQELRDVQARAEADFSRAQAAEAAGNAAKSKADALNRDWKEMQDRATNEKTQLEKKIRNLQDSNQELREELEDAKADLSTQERQSNYAIQELEQKHATLQSSVEGIQQDLESKVAALQGAQQRLAQQEREMGELENEVLRLKAQTGDTDTLAVIKKELSEQVAYIKKLEGTTREQSTELKQYRKNRKDVEVVEEEKRGLEAKIRMMDDLRKQLSEAQLQRRILEDEKNSWMAYLESESTDKNSMKYDTPELMAKAFLQERLERLSLVDKLGAVQPELSVKEANIRSLEDEKSRLQAEIEQLRASGSGNASGVSDSKARIRLERQKNLLTKEVEYLRAQMKTFEAEEAEFAPEQIDEARSQRIHELEDMVEQHRAEIQTLNMELKNVESQAVAQAGAESPRKRSREEEEESEERMGELRRKIRSLQADIDKLQTQNQMLEAERKANESQIKSLKESSKTRVLEFRNNPTSQFEAIKMSTLKTLRDENAALLDQLEGKPSGVKVVPISTLENHRAQIEELQAQIAQSDKKTMRLKQIWGSKSLEFREAVCSILGWKLDFMPNGRVKATSILNPTSIVNGEEEENSIVFDGENGTMKVSGGPQSVFAREIKSQIEFWVEGRKEIPCFLAACTLEFYDRTTRASPK